MTYKKIPYQYAAQVLDRFPASDEAKSLISQEMRIDEAISTMQDGHYYNDLIQFFAHALPVRESIWWAIGCLSSRADVWSSQQKQCIENAHQWVLQPSEESRRKSELFAQRLNLNCGPSWLSQAVFWNGSGSIVAPDLPVVLPDPFLYAKAVAGAINHAAVLPAWSETDTYYEHAITTALNIANGGNGKET